jgi:hypothetical protein
VRNDELRVLIELADMTDEQGALPRSLFPGTLTLPTHVEIQGDMLAWYDYQTSARDTSRPELPERIRAEGPILDQFIGLSANKPEGIAAFARRWGVLNMPEDWVIWHDAPANGGFWVEDGVLWSRDQGREALALWDALAAQARAILRLTARVHRGEPTAIDDWHIALTRGFLPERAAETWALIQRKLQSNRPFRNSTVARWFITDLVSAGLEQTGVRPHFSWFTAGAPEISLQGYGLRGALAVQLMAATAKADGVILCTGCGLSYIPERRPREGERRYCPACRAQKIPQRDAARDLRARRNTAGQL